METKVWMASKEVAEKLDVHVRTLRNWLDMFVPMSERQKNPQGHYLISEKGVGILSHVKERKDSGTSSLRDMQRDMINEGLIPADMLLAVEEGAENTFENVPVASTTTSTNEAFAHGQALQTAFREVEVTVQESLFQFQQELSNLSSMQQLQSTILQKISDMEERQESLRLEMRRVTFEMDLMHQRLTRRKQRLDRYESRWSLNPFRWFTRSNRSNVTVEEM